MVVQVEGQGSAGTALWWYLTYHTVLPVLDQTLDKADPVVDKDFGVIPTVSIVDPFVQENEVTGNRSRFKSSVLQYIFGREEDTSKVNRTF